ncbi:hypothetical protein A1QO_06230 [Vibrio genomosp. F10 str. ZF-129]|uniref:Uncharacterized protein n=1 Tax=Vibrio genomosp. F10 str. ZF-129 TaxID=1187848 RepID=A0A1E5BG31_9VIBR|nr:hypothetical protein [Vibrio genomosp. F10]OEE34979.1 hypothetical protein A1QO_06230 [Vibrio genomosp. F10 str. ZF-129]
MHYLNKKELQATVDVLRTVLPTQVISSILLKLESAIAEETKDNGLRTLVDCPIQDYRLTDTLPLPKTATGIYNLVVEQDKNTNTIYFNIKDQNLVPHSDLIQSGLSGMIEIRDGLPALSVGFHPDENVFHVLSDTNCEIAVVPEGGLNKPNWLPVEFSEVKHMGLIFNDPNDDDLMESRTTLANELFGAFNFGPQLEVTEQDIWEINEQSWSKVFTLSFDEPDRILRGKFHLEFFGNTTHILSYAVDIDEVDANAKRVQLTNALGECDGNLTKINSLLAFHSLESESEDYPLTKSEQILISSDDTMDLVNDGLIRFTRTSLIDGTKYLEIYDEDNCIHDDRNGVMDNFNNSLACYTQIAKNLNGKLGYELSFNSTNHGFNLDAYDLAVLIPMSEFEWVNSHESLTQFWKTCSFASKQEVDACISKNSN